MTFLKKKEDMCADKFKGMLLKNEQKAPETKQKKKNKKRKEQRAEKKFKEITELISADTSQPIADH